MGAALVCVWVARVFIVVLTLSMVFICYQLVGQPDWLYYNENITFGVVGGPFCNFNETELNDQCHNEFKTSVDVVAGALTLFLMTIGPSFALMGLFSFIHTFWFGEGHLNGVWPLQLAGIICSVAGIVMWSLMADSGFGLAFPAESSFTEGQSVTDAYGDYIACVLFLNALGILSCFIGFLDARLKFQVPKNPPSLRKTLPSLRKAVSSMAKTPPSVLQPPTPLPQAGKK
ncbi:unnamed protein product [Bursaphelenchus xylophilus]|uniref:(pine wood nematode) hypothetical protein n=1 Tax=Bursaphelenchus xylophilus TaxID=6326 RepID=A0A1I7RXB8_BURXY|nr:unnamed protein product [Bursaphelenchus xylophilus]CAG9121537.1 unnamed protein product [Bursaphelenchus xylophilus]